MDILNLTSPFAPPLIIFGSFALWALAHSLLASHTAKAFSAALFGDVHNKYYRLFYNIFAGFSILPVLGSLLLPNQPLYSVPAPLSYLFIGIQGLGAVIAGLAVLSTGGRRFLGISQLFEWEQPPRPETLKNNGLYHWVRHPIYTGSLLFIWFTPQMSWNLLALYIAFTLYFFIGSIFEERKLLADFGETYASYQARTGRILPRVRKPAGP